MKGKGTLGKQAINTTLLQNEKCARNVSWCHVHSHIDTIMKRKRHHNSIKYQSRVKSQTCISVKTSELLLHI